MGKTRPSPEKIITIRPDHYDVLKDHTHVLYRCFSRKMALLYIGMTNNPPTRFEQHRKDKIWWKYVDHITMQQFPSRRLLAEAEAATIAVEKPKFNVAIPFGASPPIRLGRRSVPIWSEPSTFGVVEPEYGHLIEATLEQQLYPCVECHARAIYANGDTVSCGLCSTEWTFDQWFAMTFDNSCDTNSGTQMTLM